mgnify:CR=1 FL=1
MPEEGEKKIEDLLNKLKQVGGIFPSFLIIKPRYVTAVEIELGNPSLKAGVYTEIPFDPFSEIFDGSVLMYFLAKDGLINKYIKIITPATAIPLFMQVIDVELKSGEYLGLVYRNSFSIMLIRSSRPLLDILHDIDEDLNEALYRIYKEPASVDIEYTGIGLEVFVRYADVELRYLMSDVVQYPFKEKVVDVSSSLTKIKYKVKGYLVSGKIGEWLIIPKAEVLDYFERVLKDYFKKA